MRPIIRILVFALLWGSEVTAQTASAEGSNGHVSNNMSKSLQNCKPECPDKGDKPIHRCDALYVDVQWMKDKENDPQHQNENPLDIKPHTGSIVFCSEREFKVEKLVKIPCVSGGAIPANQPDQPFANDLPIADYDNIHKTGKATHATCGPDWCYKTSATFRSGEATDPHIIIKGTKCPEK
jgi:hypothetical protein